MKVLIMEDEEQIREGLAEQICWQAYGIRQVFTAKNGEVGFGLAKKEMPDIILTDIRMPRMDGITVVKKLRQILPYCSIIFISAYPEKNYFKEAIRLKAVSFLEKPINMKELDQMLREAVLEQNRNQKRREQEQHAFLYKEQQLVNRLSRNQFQNKEECRQELENAGLHVDEYGLFATVLIRYAKGQDQEDENRWILFCSNHVDFAQKCQVKMLWGQKQSDLMVYHFFMREEKQLATALEWLKKGMEGINRWYILVGSIQRSVMKLQDSYADAVLLMNRAFYLSYGNMVSGTEREIFMTIDFGSWKAKFTELVKMEEFEEAGQILEACRKQILEHGKIHFTVVREFYLYLYGELGRYAEQKEIFLKERGIRGSVFFENGNYEELHREIRELLESITYSRESGEEDFIVRVKKYVNENYRNSWLSIKDIAEAAGKSVSYLCVTFKKETGITLNQYLTETRIEKAKALLDNRRNSIRKVTEECGYMDSSYFARIFKKYTGQTPSEYRGEER